MSAFQEKINKTQKINLPFIQKYISEIDEIYFKLPPEQNIYPDLSKLDLDSFWYDKKYEQTARRTELDLIYILEEICLENGFGSKNAFDALNEIQKCLFSPFFYRELISGHISKIIETELGLLLNKINESLSFVEHEIDEDDYKEAIDDIGTISTPSDKDSFLKEIKKLILFFEEKQKRLKMLTNEH